jgi:murein endopeptidase
LLRQRDQRRHALAPAEAGVIARQGRQQPELVKVQQAPPLPARHGRTDSRADLVRGNILHPTASPGPGPEYAICQPRRARYWSKPELFGQSVAERKAKKGSQELPAQRRAEQQLGTVLCH